MDKKGFTLVEVLVVICILGILAALVLGAVGSARNNWNNDVARTNNGLRLEINSLRAENDRLQQLANTQALKPEAPEFHSVDKPDSEGLWWTSETPTGIKMTTAPITPRFTTEPMVEVRIHEDRYGIENLCVLDETEWIPVETWIKIQEKAGLSLKFAPLLETNPFKK